MHMSTLQWLILDPTWVGHHHPLWQACRGKPYQVQAATTRARLLVGRLPLQAVRASYTEDDPTCQACFTAPEDTTHFLLQCPATENEVRPLIIDLQTLYSADGLPVPTTESELTSAILNGWSYTPDTILTQEHSLPTSTSCPQTPTHNTTNTPPLPSNTAPPTANSRDKVGSQRGTTATHSLIPTAGAVSLKPKGNLTPANQLSNNICHRLLIARDHAINEHLLQQDC